MVKLTSPSFPDGGRIPEKYGYTKENVNPPLKIHDVPQTAESLALVMDDPDAVEPAGKVWDHWVVWNIDPQTEEIKEGRLPSDAIEGKTDYGDRGYGGPNPPDKEHTYRFILYALDEKLDLPPSTSKDQLQDKIDDRVIEKAELLGRYSPT